MPTMSFVEFVGTILSSSLLSLAVAAGLFNYWVKTRLKESIHQEYAKELEQFKFEMRKREQSILVADLFSKWCDVKNPNEGISSSEEQRLRDLNRLSFEMSLWLPTDELAIEINNMLKLLVHAKPPQDLLVECRKVIQGTETTKLKPEHITFFNTGSLKGRDKQISDKDNA